MLKGPPFTLVDENDYGLKRVTNPLRFLAQRKTHGQALVWDEPLAGGVGSDRRSLLDGFDKVRHCRNKVGTIVRWTVKPQTGTLAAERGITGTISIMLMLSAIPSSINPALISCRI
jgi:hypothetical protein